MGTYKCCIFFTRRFALGDTTTPEDVRMLFSRYAGGSPYMGADDLCRYLAAWGGADGEVPEHIVDRVLQDRSRTPRFGRPALTVDDFRHFLFSDDLNPPLRHYKVKPTRKLIDAHWFGVSCVHCGGFWMGEAHLGGGLRNVVILLPIANHIGICGILFI